MGSKTQIVLQALETFRKDSCLLKSMQCTVRLHGGTTAVFRSALEQIYSILPHHSCPGQACSLELISAC